MKRFRDAAVAWGPWGVFLFAVIDSAGVPNPGGTDLLLLAVTIADPASAWLCALLAVSGSILGSVIFYEILSRGGDRYLSKMTASASGRRFRAWFQRYGMIAVFIPALLPVPFLPFKALAGVASAMNVGRVRYLLVILAGRIPRYVALAYLGATLGNDSLHWISAHVWPMAAAAALLFAALYLLIRFAAPNRPDIE